MMPAVMPSNTHTFHQVDAFTDRAFAGNPAAVFILDKPADEQWMRNVAREMNLSETAFTHRVDGQTFNLRWFTPAVEVDLCGHATLAAAHVMWETNVVPRSTTLKFQSRSGILTARWSDGWIELDFPASKLEPAESSIGAELKSALGVNVVEVYRTAFDLLVVVESEADVRAMNSDISKLHRLRGRGIIVTARAQTSPYDFVSRFFAPAAGVDEDPVTGSAHCALTPYWSKQLNKTCLLAYQASARGGVVRVELRGDRVLLGGQAVSVVRGELIA
jgi:PhzF family phenazine biosynthesis protein